MSDLIKESIHALHLCFTLSVVILILANAIIQKVGIIYQYFHKVDTESDSHGGELVADTLKAHGVNYIFTLVGGHISPILAAAKKIGIRVVDTRHEVTTVFAADAVARLSGKVGVVAVTAGPGFTNIVTAVKNAQMAESPILLLGGAAASTLKGRGALQDIDQMALFKPLCKYTATVTRIRDIIPTLQQAIMYAQSGTPGPVFVGFPIDSLCPYKVVKKKVISSDGPARSLMQHVEYWYLKNYLCNLFAGAFEPRDMSPLHVRIPRASSKQVQSCVEMLTRAKKPVFVFGSQAVLPPVPAEELREAVENIGIPCFLGGMTRGLLGRDSPLHIRQNRRAALKEADLVILAGNVCDFRLDYGKVLPKKGNIISINRNHSRTRPKYFWLAEHLFAQLCNCMRLWILPKYNKTTAQEQLKKNSDMFGKPTMAIQGDVGSFILEVAKLLGDRYSCSAEWLDQLKQGDIEKEKKNKEKAEEPTNIHLNPIKVLETLEDVLSDDSILVADRGDFVETAACVVKPRGPLRWLDPGAFRTLGVGGGFALGAKLVRPESDVWIVYGDGSLGYSVAEFDTFVRHKLPVLALVGNDAGWTQIEKQQVPMFGSNVERGLRFTDYHVVAKGYGGEGMLLRRGDDVKATLEQAQSVSREKNLPVLVNALIGKTAFREGSISV